MCVCGKLNGNYSGRRQYEVDKLWKKKLSIIRNYFESFRSFEDLLWIL